MAVLSLPVHPREVYLAQVNSRATQQSAFNPAAIQHVASAGSAWEGYMDLPPLFSQHDWNRCKDVIGKVYSGSDRLWVPVLGGEFDFAGFLGTYPEVTDEQFCNLHIRATLNRDGDKVILSEPAYVDSGGVRGIVTWDSDSLFLVGTNITLSWWTRTGATWMADRAAMTRAILREHARLQDYTSITSADATEITSISAVPVSLYWRPSLVGTLSNNVSGPSTAFTDTYDLLTLDPPVPHMFRADTASADGNWCVVQANFCEPFVAAVIVNDDALGFTKPNDRHIIPNRIEFVSSNIWA